MKSNNSISLKCSLIISLVLLQIFCIAQENDSFIINNTKTIQDIIHKENLFDYKKSFKKKIKVKYLKQVAFCECIKYYFHDSLLEDKYYSGVQKLWDIYNLDLKIIENLDSVSKMYVSNLRAVPWMKYEAPNVTINGVLTDCIDFYDSKYLKKFIKNELKHKVDEQ